MKRIIILVAAVVLVSATPVFAIDLDLSFDDWSKKDYTLQIMASVLHTIDWLQTREIATNNQYRESNPILGNDPNLKQVDLYMGATLIGSWLLSDSLPKKWRTRFQYLHIGIEGYAVSQNIGLGVGFKF